LVLVFKKHTEKQSILTKTPHWKEKWGKDLQNKALKVALELGRWFGGFLKEKTLNKGSVSRHLKLLLEPLPTQVVQKKGVFCAVEPKGDRLHKEGLRGKTQGGK